MIAQRTWAHGGGIRNAVWKTTAMAALVHGRGQFPARRRDHFLARPPRSVPDCLLIEMPEQRRGDVLDQMSENSRCARSHPKRRSAAQACHALLLGQTIIRTDDLLSALRAMLLKGVTFKICPLVLIRDIGLRALSNVSKLRQGPMCLRV
jgi:hypothetical protein